MRGVRFWGRSRIVVGAVLQMLVDEGAVGSVDLVGSVAGVAGVAPSTVRNALVELVGAGVVVRGAGGVVRLSLLGALWVEGLLERVPLPGARGAGRVWDGLVDELGGGLEDFGEDGGGE